MGLGKPSSLWKLQEKAGLIVEDYMGAAPGTAFTKNIRRFNGVTDYVTFSSFKIPIGAKTIKFKFRRDSNPTAKEVFLDDCMDDVTATGIRVVISNTGQLTFSSVNNLSTQYLWVLSTSPVCDNQWHEIMLTWDGSINADAVKVFVDDLTKPIATTTANQVPSGSPTYTLNLGRIAAGTEFGKFDIADLWITDGPNGSGTVIGWWKMNENTATNLVGTGAGAWPGFVTGTTIIRNETTPITLSDGEGGYARFFDGRNETINFPSQVLPLGAKRIRFKVKVFNTSKDLCIMSNDSGIARYNGTSIIIKSGGKVLFASSGGSTGYRFYVESPSNTIVVNQWHEVMVVWDGTLNEQGVQIYIDDMETPKVTGTSSKLETANAYTNLIIGGTTNVNTLFEGYLKDVQVYAGNGNERTNPKDLLVGDFIRANYQAPMTDSWGKISGLGENTANFLPTTPGPTPSGDFYFVMVEDKHKVKYLLADRNIQSSISWDTLNLAGIASGSGLPVGSLTSQQDDVVPFSYIIRLPTGGTVNGDLLAEWNRWLLKSTFSDSIIASENSFWNWQGSYSHASTTPSGSSSRVLRGNGSASTHTSTGYTVVNPAYGFRPVLEIELLTGPPTFNLTLDKKNVHKHDVVLSGNITSDYPTQYKILVNNVEAYATETFEKSPSVHFIATNNTLVLGVNTVVVIATDTVGETSRWKSTVEVVDQSTILDFSLSQTSIHGEDVTLEGTISDPDSDDLLSYRILANTTVISAWSVPSSEPITLSQIIPNNLLPVGTNIIKVEVASDFKEQSLSKTAEVVVTNELPVFDFKLTPDSTHGGEVTLSGKITNVEEDKLSYRVYLNEKLYQDWSDFSESPLTVNMIMDNKVLNVGDNKIVIEARDDFKNNLETQAWAGAVSILDNVPEAVVTLTPTSLHYGNSKLTATISDSDGDKISYKILVNNKQYYPASGFTTPAATPVTLDFTVYNNYLKSGANPVKIIYKDNFKTQEEQLWAGVITATNSTPLFTPSAITETVGSKESAVIKGTLTDLDGDKVAYQILVGGVAVTDWSEYLTNNSAVELKVPANQLLFGSNQISVALKDDYRDGGTNSWSTVIQKVNNPPKVEASVVGMTLRVNLSDPDSDSIQYCVKLNGNQIYPAIDSPYTPLASGPLTYTKTFTSSDGILIGSENTVDVEVLDEFGLATTGQATFVGTYAGLMFSDPAGSYYSTDLGIILMYLDLGVIISGQITDSYPIRLINKNGYKVKNARLSTDNNTLPKGAWLEISKTDAPFAPSTVLTYPQVLNYDEEVTFHVRIATSIDSDPGEGNFKLYVKADPVE